MNNAKLWDNIMLIALWALAVAVCLIPVLMIVDLIMDGSERLSLAFLLEPPRDAGREGGVGSLILSTGLILLVCMSVVLSIGSSCALYLSHYVRTDSKLSRQLGKSLDVLAGIPSIVYGLFGYVFFSQWLGLGFSILSGGLALACMALPLYVRLAEQALRQVPESYRLAAEALNISQAGYAFRIAIPAAAPGLAAAVIVAAGRALAETAVLIFTAGYVTRTPESLYDSGRSLSVHIYDLAMNVPGGTATAAATALVLMLLLVGFNLAARRLIGYSGVRA